jgi:dihydrolipoyl dehydrogenase
VSAVEVRVPDLGDFTDVDVIEIYVKAGDEVAPEDPLIAIETDKAAMDVPAPRAGTVDTVAVGVGDKVSPGDLILTLKAGADAGGAGRGDDDGDGVDRVPGKSAAAEPAAAEPNGNSGASLEARQAPGRRAGDSARSTASGGERGGPAEAPAGTAPAQPGTPGGSNIVVLGSGPGGYTAAFRAADLGLSVTLVERYPTLGGVCLNVGCIPSKALLHVAKVIEDASEAADFGIAFDSPRVDLDRLRDWKSRVVRQLTNGLESLAQQRKVKVVHGSGRFVSAQAVAVTTAHGEDRIEFDQCIIAAGSEPVAMPGVPEDPRILDSTGALELRELPKRMLVIGGGIIGLEMATVYDALGTHVSVVELTKTLMPGCDRDLVRPLQKRIANRYEAIMTGTRSLASRPAPTASACISKATTRPTHRDSTIAC